MALIGRNIYRKSLQLMSKPLAMLSLVGRERWMDTERPRTANTEKQARLLRTVKGMINDIKTSHAAKLPIKKFVTVGLRNRRPIAMQTVPFPRTESTKNTR